MPTAANLRGAQPGTLMTDLLEVGEEPVPEAAPAFRTIHYLGNKWRLLDAIEEAVDSVVPRDRAVCDLFSGSAVVAARLARHHYVVASDIQEYARVLASALLQPASISPAQVRQLFDEAAARDRALRSPALERLIAHERTAAENVTDDPEGVCDILEHGSIVGWERSGSEVSETLGGLLATAASELPRSDDNVLTRYYGGVYFSYEQALALDSLAAAARQAPAYIRDLALAAVISTASEAVSTVGNHFAQPVRPRDARGRPKLSTVVSVARRRQRASVPTSCARWMERYRQLAPLPHGGDAIRADYREVLGSMPNEVSAVYADPPYTRDHYSRFYHVLETIALGDEPDVSLVTIGMATKASRGLYRKDRHQSPFCIKSEAPGAFRSMFEAVAERKLPLVLSYSPYESGTGARPRLMTIEALTSLAGEHFRHVEVRSAGRIAHSKLNADRLNAEMSYEAEVFVVCTP